MNNLRKASYPIIATQHTDFLSHAPSLCPPNPVLCSHSHSLAVVCVVSVFRFLFYFTLVVFHGSLEGCNQHADHCCPPLSSAVRCFSSFSL